MATERESTRALVLCVCCLMSSWAPAFPIQSTRYTCARSSDGRAAVETETGRLEHLRLSWSTSPSLPTSAAPPPHILLPSCQRTLQPQGRARETASRSLILPSLTCSYVPFHTSLPGRAPGCYLLPPPSFPPQREAFIASVHSSLCCIPPIQHRPTPPLPLATRLLVSSVLIVLT